MVITLKNILYEVRLPVSSNERAYFLYPLKLLLPLPLPLPLPLYPELDSS